MNSLIKAMVWGAVLAGGIGSAGAATKDNGSSANPGQRPFVDPRVLYKPATPRAVISSMTINGSCSRKGAYIFLSGLNLAGNNDRRISLKTLPPDSTNVAALRYTRWTDTNIVTEMPSDSRIELGKAYLIGLTYYGRPGEIPLGSWVSNTMTVKVCEVETDRSERRLPSSGLAPASR